MVLNPETIGKQNCEKSEKKSENGQIELKKISPKDKVWDRQKTNSVIVSQIYGNNSEFSKQQNRMECCANILHFARQDDGLKLKLAYFCRVRNCPVCQWRKSLLWKAMMLKVYDQLQKQYPTHRWLFMTLTVQNCAITELRQTLQDMGKAWQRLLKRKEFANVVGWVRTTEVTRDTARANSHAHPHFHAILLVKPSYFSHGYVKHEDWARVWGECLRVSYIPNVDIRTVKPKDGDHSSIRGVISETLKYAVKPSDLIGDDQNPTKHPQKRTRRAQNAQEAQKHPIDPISAKMPPTHAQEWLYEFTRQTHKLRFVASGGALKNALKPTDELSSDEMVHINAQDNGDAVESNQPHLAFAFCRTETAYRRDPAKDRKPKPKS